jgi:beta-N-acetylhexosaminidase
VSDDWTERTLHALTPRRLAAQLVMPRIGGEYVAAGTASHEQLRHWVEDLRVGGVIISIGAPLETACKLNMLQAMSAVPLLVGADMEHGPGQILRGGTVLPYGLQNGGGTRFPPLMALAATGDERFAWELGRITALEGRAAGVHVAFAPVVDVNNNPANPIINTRSYGADPVDVARFAVAHVRGIQDHGMLATAKHFPGHGDASTDSHLRLPFIDADRRRLDAVELPSFRAAFAAGVAAVMSAHVAFPALTGDDLPGTLNPRILTTLLRNELGFEGLVFTDGLDMGAITDGHGGTGAALLALEAGADVLLQPRSDDVEAVIDAVVAAMASGRLTKERVRSSVRRVLAAKQRLGLYAGAQVDVERVMHVVGIDAHRALARDAAERSMTLVRDAGNVLPLRGRRVFVLCCNSEYDPFTGRELLRGLAEGATVDGMLADARTTAAELQDAGTRADAADVVIVAPFIRAGAGNPSLGVPAEVVRVIHDIAARRPTALVAFGNPYIIGQLPDMDTFVVAWGAWEPLQSVAARALLGDAPMPGRMPVPLPQRNEQGSASREVGEAVP